MSDAIIIEIRGLTAGIVARTPGGFAFYAATRPFYALEKQLFRSPRHAEKAARTLLDLRRAPPAPVQQAQA